MSGCACTHVDKVCLDCACPSPSAQSYHHPELAPLSNTGRWACTCIVSRNYNSHLHKVGQLRPNASAQEQILVWEGVHIELVVTLCTGQVEGALERILADVKPPPHAVPVWNEAQQHQEAAFNTANAAAQPAVYFSPDVYQDLAQLYHTLQERLVASAPLPVDPKKGRALSLSAMCLNMQLSDGAGEQHSMQWYSCDSKAPNLPYRLHVPTRLMYFCCGLYNS